MSASDEIDEMHLTSGGWVQGSQKLDFSGWTRVDAPADSLLTVRFREYMSSVFASMELTASESRIGSDEQILAALRVHGAEPRPDAHRYQGWPEFLTSIGYERDA